MAGLREQVEQSLGLCSSRSRVVAHHWKAEAHHSQAGGHDAITVT